MVHVQSMEWGWNPPIPYGIHTENSGECKDLAERAEHCNESNSYHNSALSRSIFQHYMFTAALDTRGRGRSKLAAPVDLQLTVLFQDGRFGSRRVTTSSFCEVEKLCTSKRQRSDGRVTSSFECRGSWGGLIPKSALCPHRGFRFLSGWLLAFLKISKVCPDFRTQPIFCEFLSGSVRSGLFWAPNRLGGSYSDRKWGIELNITQTIWPSHTYSTL